jgi:hypothetical protein
MSLRTGVESCFVHRKSAQLGSSNMKSLTKQDPSGELSGRPSGPMLTFQKSDLWLAESALSSEGVRGAVGFRKMKDSAVFATGQPTEEGLSTILKAVHKRCPTVSTIVWVCLREEPLVMINGKPHR